MEGQTPGQGALVVRERSVPVDVEQAQSHEELATVALGSSPRRSRPRGRPSSRRPGHARRPGTARASPRVARSGRRRTGRRWPARRRRSGRPGSRAPRGRRDGARRSARPGRHPRSRWRLDPGGGSDRPCVARRPTSGRPRRCASSSTRPLASSRSYGRAGRFQAGVSAVPVRTNASRHHSCVRSPFEPAVALADLEQRHIRAALADVALEDLQQAAEQRSGA